LLGLVVAPTLHAGEVKVELDSAVDGQLFDSTRFARYGFAGKATILREPQGIRFQLPSSSKGLDQTGLSSTFAVAGDFEFSATYEWIDVPAPTRGYGVSCGIAVERAEREKDGSRKIVALARAHLPGKSSRYVVTRSMPADSKEKFQNDYFPTQAKKGRLILRREQAELICLAEEGGLETREELCRVPFTDTTVRPVRLFVDNGGSPTAMDVRLTQVSIKAEEVAHGIVHHEAQGMAWWTILLIVLGVLALLGLGYRRFMVLKNRGEEL